MSKFGICLTLSAVALLTGCGGKEEYTPAAGMSGEKIFQEACSRCHSTPADLKLAPEQIRPKAIIEKVQNGSMMMPAYPNIQGAELDALAEYVSQNASKK